MKRVFSFLARALPLAALMATMGACEKHPWSETSQFFKPHGAGGHDAHGTDAAHATEAGHETGHGDKAAGAHGTEGAAAHKEETKSFFPEKKE